jgi:hypothetical protein
VCLSGDRIYTTVNGTLYVYSLSDHASPIATFHVGGRCFSCILIDNRLYLGGLENLIVLDVTTSLTEPLTTANVIDTHGSVFKLLRTGDELLLGE